MPKCRYPSASAGEETLLQFAFPPRVGTFQITRSVEASRQKATPEPSTTYTRPSATTGAVKTASVKATAPTSPSGVLTLRSGTLPECRQSYFNCLQSSAGAAAGPNSKQAANKPAIRVHGNLNMTCPPVARGVSVSRY